MDEEQIKYTVGCGTQRTIEARNKMMAVEKFIRWLTENKENPDIIFADEKTKPYRRG